MRNGPSSAAQWTCTPLPIRVSRRGIHSASVGQGMVDQSETSRVTTTLSIRRPATYRSLP